MKREYKVTVWFHDGEDFEVTYWTEINKWVAETKARALYNFSIVRHAYAEIVK